MFGSSILKQLFQNVIDTKYVRAVYHSVVMKPLLDGGGIKPAAPMGTKFIYVGVDDSKGFTCYCRQIGSLEVIRTDKIGGCDLKLYKTQVPHRIVFFNDRENRQHEDITSKLLSSVVGTSKIVLSKVITDPQQLLQSEAPTGKFNFTVKTYYVGIDFFVLLDIKADNCEQEINCTDTDNPFTGSIE